MKRIARMTVALALGLGACSTSSTHEGSAACRGAGDCPSSFPICRADMRCWSTPDDAGMGGDAGGDAGPTAPLTVMGAPASLGCVGIATAPVAGAPGAQTVTLTELNSHAPITSTDIQVWLGEEIGDGCPAGACVAVTTDASGTASVTAPADGWVGYHILGNAQTVEVLAYHQPFGGGGLNPAGFSAADYASYATSVGRVSQASSGTIFGIVRDCTGAHMAGAEVRVFIQSARVVTGAPADPAAPTVTGVQSGPTADGRTGDFGFFEGVNLPPGDFRVEVWGAPTAGAAPQLVGCETGRVVAGAATVFEVGPLRADYPAGHACSTVPRM